MTTMECDGDVCSIRTLNNDTTINGIEFKLPNVSDEWTVYGNENCGWCVEALKLLKNYQVMYHTVGIQNMSELFNYLGDTIGSHRSIPVIFQRGVFIGGYSELVKVLE